MTTFWVQLAVLIAAFHTTLSNQADSTNASDLASNQKASETVNASLEKSEIPDEYWEYENTTIVDSRRILYSKRTPPGKRPYMVYLQLTLESAKAHKYRGWLCGGVVVHEYYVLTSAACVEDADHFYIVSGTTKYVDAVDYKNNECVCKNRRKVVWKCIPKNYKFDFHDTMKWSSNDIAIVKVNKPFAMGVVERGCEFAVESVSYNNQSRDLEKAGTKGYIAGWGSGSNFREGVYRRQDHIPDNAKCLQEAKVCIMDNEQCVKKWAQKFRSIIEQYMICTKDVMKRLSEICDKKYANCTEVESKRRNEEESAEVSTNTVDVDLGRHLRDPDDVTARRSSMYGGFCENDHGGPLIVKYLGRDRIVGIISACKIDPKSHNCHGPFLYTSVFRNRQFIQCSIHKDTEDPDETCRRVFRGGITHEEWTVDWNSVKEDEDDRADDGSKSTSVESLRRRKKQHKKKKSSRTKDAVKSKESESLDIEDKSREESLEKNEKDDGDKVLRKGKKHKSSKKKGKKSKKSRARASPEKEAMSYESSKDENVNEPDE